MTRYLINLRKKECVDGRRYTLYYPPTRLTVTRRLSRRAAVRRVSEATREMRTQEQEEE